MESYSTQKFISIFLGLAILISSITLILSGLIDSNPKYNITSNNENNQQNPTELTKPAFVESPKNLVPYYGTISLNDLSVKPSGNLTEDFVSYAAAEIIKNNPNGPQINESGGQNIIIPEIEDLSDHFVQNFVSEEKFNDVYNKKDKELENYNFKITNNSSSSINSYFNKFKNIYKEYLIDKNNNILSDLDYNYNNYNLSLEALSQLNNDFYKEILNLEVPEGLINFHKKFSKILAYQKETINQFQKINSDPLYVYYLIEKGDEKVLSTINEFEKEAEKISNEYLSNQNVGKKNNNLIIDFVQKLIIPQKAYALFGIPSIVFDPKAVAQLIKQNWREQIKSFKNLILEITRDRIVHRLINQIVNWVQGGGKPQFVTNWKNFLLNAASEGIGDTFSKLYPEICQPFRPLLEIAFNQVSAYDKGVSCTLGNTVNNLENFYNTFKYGGWISYASILEPQNNLLGILIISRDESLKKSSQNKEVQKNDAQASKGFLSMKTCVKQKVITSLEKEKALNKEELKKILGRPLNKDEKLMCGPINKEGFSVAEGSCAVVKCEEYQNTTPGALVGDTIGNSIVAGPLGRIIHAQDIKILMSAFINSAINKLIRSGVKGLTGVLTNKNEISNNAVSDLKSSCYGAIPGTEDYDNCKSLENDPIYNQNIEESDSADILDQARNILDQLKNGLQANEEWLNISKDVQQKIQIIGGCSTKNSTTTENSTNNKIESALCPNLSKNVCSLYDQIEEIKPLVEQEKTSLSESIEELSNMINQINSKPLNIQEANEIQNKISRYNNVSISKPIERLNSIKELQSKLNISDSSECDKIILP